MSIRLCETDLPNGTGQYFHGVCAISSDVPIPVNVKGMYGQSVMCDKDDRVVGKIIHAWIVDGKCHIVAAKFSKFNKGDVKMPIVPQEEFDKMILAGTPKT